jgi:hypothetical protein
MHPGKVFWCGYDNTASAALAAFPNRKSASDGNKGGFLDPFKTLDYAIGKCVASRGDIIMLLPGHSEDLTAAGTIDSDVAGVAVVGLGTGSLQPKIISQAAAATHVIDAANCTFHNINWVASFADVTIGLDVGATADGLTFSKCRWTEEAADLNYVNVIDLATGANNLAWYDCQCILGDASNDAFITGVAHDGFIMDNCYVAHNVAQTAAHGQVDSSGNVTNVQITNCRFRSNIDGALHIDFNGAANGGFVSNCHFSSIDTAGAVAAAVDFTGGHVFNCLVSGEADLSGITVHGPYVDA